MMNLTKLQVLINEAVLRCNELEIDTDTVWVDIEGQDHCEDVASVNMSTFKDTAIVTIYGDSYVNNYD